MRIIFATHNQNKLMEIRQILSDTAEEIVSKGELGISFEPAETGRSFGENAELKAVGIREYMRLHGLLREGDIILADDSGLCVDWLRGAPGIYSARYLGEATGYDVKNRHIIEKLRHAEGEERAAHFTCNICAAFADGRVFHTEGIFPGRIAEEPRGENGFGYDPILYLPELGKTSAELSPEEKNQLSHRGKALREMRRVLQSVMENDEKLRARIGQPEKRKGRRILVVSDSHRSHDGLLRLIREQQPIDVLIHLGDLEEDEGIFRRAAGEHCACYFVEGNNDFFSSLPREIELNLGRKRAFLTHGHSYRVGLDVTRLAEEARARNCQIAMFGHTHKPFLKEVDGVLCLNPGSVSFPRQANRTPSYMLIEETADGELRYHPGYLR